MTGKRKTLESWNEAGRRVHKGSKAAGFTSGGLALFSEEQTYIRADRYPGGHGPSDRRDVSFFGGNGNPDPMDFDIGLCGQI